MTLTLGASILFAWTVVHTAIALSYFVIYARRPSFREYLAYSLIEAGMALYSAGGTVLWNCESVAAGTLGCNIGYAGCAITAWGLVELPIALGKKPDKWLRKAAAIWMMVGLIASGTGIFFDPAFATEDINPTTAYHEPRMIPTCQFWINVAIVFVFIAWWKHVRGSTDPYLPKRPMSWAAWGTIATSTYDFSIHSMAVGTYYIFQHFAVAAALLFAHVLLRRYLRQQQELDENTRAVEVSVKQRSLAQKSLLKEEHLAVMGTLSGVIAHEVRNPLATLTNAASALKRPTLKDDDRNVLVRIVDEETERLDRFVTDLLAYARPPEEAMGNIDIQDLCNTLPTQIMQDLNGRVRIDTQCSATGNLQGDKRSLREVLSRLLWDACELTPEGEPVRLSVRQATVQGQSGIAITVEDQGTDMGREAPREKGPFKLSKPRTRSALTMAMADRLARVHGGRLEVLPNQDGWNRTTLYLQRIPPSLDQIEPHAAA